MKTSTQSESSRGRPRIEDFLGSQSEGRRQLDVDAYMAERIPLVDAALEARFARLAKAPETLPEINRILQELVAQGQEALPALRQYLERGEDLRLTEVMDAADLPDYGSIRLGLFDALRGQRWF